MLLDSHSGYSCTVQATYAAYNSPWQCMLRPPYHGQCHQAGLSQQEWPWLSGSQSQSDMRLCFLSAMQNQGPNIKGRSWLNEQIWHKKTSLFIFPYMNYCCDCHSSLLLGTSIANIVKCGSVSKVFKMIAFSKGRGICGIHVRHR